MSELVDVDLSSAQTKNFVGKSSDFAKIIQRRSSEAEQLDGVGSSVAINSVPPLSFFPSLQSSIVPAPYQQSPDNEGWQPCIDTETKEQFWVNHRTKQVSMVEPPCLRAPPPVPSGTRPMSFDRSYAGTHFQEPPSAGSSGWISADAMEQLKVPSGPNSNSSGGGLSSSGIMEGPASPFMAEQHNSKDVSIDLVVIEGQTKDRKRNNTPANRKSEMNSRLSPQVIAPQVIAPQVIAGGGAVSESQTAVSKSQTSPTAGGGEGKKEAGRGGRSLLPRLPKLFKKKGDVPSIPPSRGGTSEVLGEINHGEVAC